MANLSTDSERSLKGRLTAYRPLFDRVLFGIALLGVLVAVHLLIQQGRGFDRGCLGFSAPASVESTVDCQLVTQSGAGKLLGLSNAWWGIGFYLAVAGLSAAAAFARRRFPFAAFRALLIAGGFLYSAYLTYHQFAGIGAFCVLCLTSAAIALALFIVQAVMLVAPGDGTAAASSDASSPSSNKTSAMRSPASRRRPALWAGAVVALLVLVGADVMYFAGLDEATETASAEAAASETPASEAPARSTAAPRTSPSASADTTYGDLPPGCRYTPNQEPVDPNRLVGFTDPVFGTQGAPVTVVEFFDPNCPHCKTFHSVMEGLVAEYGDEARFVYKPIPLWGYSVNQISALHTAAQQGKFEEMLEAQFARQQRGGLSDDQLAEIARQIDMNPDAMLAQIRQQRYQQQIMRDRQLAQESGVRGTPAVSINGRLVARRARTPQCVSALLEREIEQADQQSSGSS